MLLVWFEFVVMLVYRPHPLAVATKSTFGSRMNMSYKVRMYLTFSKYLVNPTAYTTITMQSYHSLIDGTISKELALSGIDSFEYVRKDRAWVQHQYLVEGLCSI